jgi:hypothetical protein
MAVSKWIMNLIFDFGSGLENKAAVKLDQYILCYCASVDFSLVKKNLVDEINKYPVDYKFKVGNDALGNRHSS